MTDEVRYLTFTPWPGQLNNTRMCFETALVLAWLTGRRLVMPTEYRRHDQPEGERGVFRPLHPRECFELERVAEIVPLVERDEYDRLGRPESQADLDFEPGRAVFCFPHAPLPGSKEAHRLRGFAASRKRILELTPEMQSCRTLNIQSPALEQFYAFFYCLQPEVELACKRLVKERVRFRAPIVSTADKIVAALGDYCALHIRRNDFFNQYPEQNLPARQILAAVMKRVPAGTHLYISTDEADRSFFAALHQRYEIRFLRDFAGLLPDGAFGEWMACVEQLVSASAAMFIGTRLSTFSAYITRLRGYRGAADKNTYFTDGSPGSELDDRGLPGFSWTNWVTSGNPLWGREFREAWEFY
jgi:hypothetical protein